MPHDHLNTAIADAMGALGLPEALAWEPAYQCPNGHDNHDDGCRHVCGQFDQEIGDACVNCQAAIGRGGPRDFRDPRWLLPALEAYSDKTGWRPIHEYAGDGDYIASFFPPRDEPDAGRPDYWTEGPDARRESFHAAITELVQTLDKA